jgi:membrane protease subunit HflK
MSDAFETEPQDDQAAGRSLGDALAISFKVLRVLFALLLVAFLLSGVFTVNSDEVAVRTAFGRITGGGEGQALQAGSGPYFRWPRPVGEVVRIPTAERELRINNAFAFQTNNLGSVLAEAQFARAPYDPQFGLLLTGDRNIVFARYRVLYQVRPEDAIAFLQNAGPDDLAALASTEDPDNNLLFARADEIVAAAVEEAIVADTASRDIEAFRSNRAATADGDDAAAAEASQDTIRAKAQATLDRLGTGLRITNIYRPETTVPPPVRPSFDALNAALQIRSQIVSQSQAARRTTLTSVAGEASSALLLAIDAYDNADAAEDEATRDAAAETIRRILAGEPVAAPLRDLAADLDDDDPLRNLLLAEVERQPNATVSGRAFELISNARTDASTIRREAESLVNRTQSLLAEYERDPARVRARLLLATVRSILGRDSATVEYIPSIGRLNDVIPPDPDRPNEAERRQLGLEQ